MATNSITLSDLDCELCKLISKRTNLSIIDIRRKDIGELENMLGIQAKPSKNYQIRYKVISEDEYYRRENKLQKLLMSK